MVSTPKSNTSNDSSKINIMSPYEDFSQYIDPASTESPQLKSEVYDSPWFDIIAGNDILANDLDLFQSESIYDISPILTSSMTTPSLVIEGDVNDSPIYNTTSSFAASPSLDPPPLGFFPELPSDASITAAARRSLVQLAIAPSVTIPVDDPLTAITGNSNLSSALNIPWSTETTGSSSTDLLQNSSPLMTNYSGNNSENNSPKSSSSTVVSSPSTPNLNKLNSRNRKRTNVDVEKDPQIVADEAAAKRAKNTDAARRSRERKVEKMKELERQVAQLKTENNELQTKIAVLESEKRGLEDMNSEKDTRIKTLEQRFEALISSRK